MVEKRPDETLDQFVDRIVADSNKKKPNPLDREMTPLEKRWAIDNEDIAEIGHL